MPTNVSSACSSCSIAGRSRWLVGSSSTSRLAPLAIRSANDALVRSPGDKVPAPRWTCSAPRPNLASKVRASAIASPVAAMNASSNDSSPTNADRACSISPTITLAPSELVPASGTIRPSSNAINVVLPLPFGPTRATRSPTRRSRSTGPSRNDPRSTTAPRTMATTSPLRPGLGIVNRSSHASCGSSTASNRSAAFWVRAAFPASCSVWFSLK